MSIRVGFAIQRYLRLRAGWVWNQQNRAFRHGLSLQEETITEMLLLRMAKDRSKHGMRVRMFNKRQEGKNGADWEWFIRTRYCSLGLRVQAKRLYHRDTAGDKDYGGLDPDSSQIDTLISKAGSKLPVYVFFNHNHGTNSRLLKAGSSSWEYQGRTFWGCSIASAHEVKKANSNKLKDMLKNPGPNMVPWHRMIDSSGQCNASGILTATVADEKTSLDAPMPVWVNTLSRIEGIQSDEAEVSQSKSEETEDIQSDFEETGRISMYLERNELAGVAYLDFSDFKVPERKEVI